MPQISAETLLPFDSPDADLATAGGKGANLARLTRAGFPVPPGWILSTAAYRAFVAANDLENGIRAALENLSGDDTQALEGASARIRAAFAAGNLPAEIETALRAAFAAMSGVPLAVRSSATAEDLPDLSFAGQQDTYLNIWTEAQLLQAVVSCWSSLWTARAIGYRLRNGVEHAGAALAVVVQQMVASEVSGVLFTANPLTGRRNETVIDAAFGLGEALVSGQVEPDHFVVNSAGGTVKEKTLGAKQVATRAKAGGGVETVAEDAALAGQTLTDDQLCQLVAAGQKIQQEYGAPQDIEWALAGGRLYILQARPVTSLFPLPRVSFDPLIAWISFGSVQGVMGPMTPLGHDVVSNVVASAGHLFHLSLSAESQQLMMPAGERIWTKVSDVLRNPLGRKIMGAFLGIIEPSAGQILRSLASDPRLGVGKGRLKPATLRRLAGFFLPLVLEMAGVLLNPAKGRARFDTLIDERLGTTRVPPAADRFERLANAAAFLRHPGRVATSLPFLLPRFIPILGPCLISLNLLEHLSGDGRLAMEVTRALPRNVTTEMDLALWQVATLLRADAETVRLFHQLDAAALADRYLQGALPPAAQAAIAGFLEKYGMRGVGEIDFGQPRWREDPSPVMHVLRSYLDIDPQAAPDVQFARGEQAAQAAIEKLAALARRQPGGWLKEKLARGAARRIRLLMGARESPKFFAVRTMGIARGLLLQAGAEFAAAGTINCADDLSYLKIAELEELSRQVVKDWQALIAARRAAYQRELRRRQVPRVLLSDGRAFYEGVGSETDSSQAISGSPVSAGVVEGIVHVVLDPRSARLAPGEILVCPGTDPAWTPLFMAAGGLITEVGGMMTHGSVVAREYGIPAVVGVHQATLRLKNGQRICLDGTTGKIVVL